MAQAPDTIDLTPYDLFKATGTDRQGRRNPPVTSSSIFYLQGLNYWTKSVWGRVGATGKWKLLYRVWN